MKTLVALDNWFKDRYKNLNIDKNTKDIAKFEIKLLTLRLNQWTQEYYVESKPTVTDSQYDAALKLLEQWEKKFPKYICTHSPTQRLNIQNTKFVKKPHPTKMLSIKNAFIAEDIHRFLRSIEKGSKNITKHDLFALEPKVDGVSIELFYRDGYLQQALTRGDGISGSDITVNIFNIPRLLKKLKQPATIIIRGELYIPTQVITQYRSDYTRNKNMLSQRNIVSGLVQRRKFPEKDTFEYFYSRFLKKSIRFWPYSIINPQEFKLYKQSQIFKYITHLGYNCKNSCQTTNSFFEIEKYYREASKRSYPFEIDGIVIKLNNFIECQKFGSSHKFHKWMIAWKLVEEQASTTIKSYNVTVGRTGKITYIAHVEPILVDMTVVSRVTMNNYCFIKQSKFFINSKVVIKKSGGIIPKIIKVQNVFEGSELKLIPIPKSLLCPSCSWVLFDDIRSSIFNNKEQLDQIKKITEKLNKQTLNKGETYIQRCLNRNCNGAIIEKIRYFCSQEGLNIQTISRKSIQKFVNSNTVRSAVDLYRLISTPDVIVTVLNSQIMADKLISELKNSLKCTDLGVILNALGFNMIGRATWEELLKVAPSWTEIQKMTRIDLELIFNKAFCKQKNNFSNKRAQIIFDTLANLDNIDLIDELLSNFRLARYNNTQHLTISNLLVNKKIAISGKFEGQKRPELIKLIKKHSGKYAAIVTQTTSFLITDGITSGKKIQKAKEHNTDIISLQTFFDIIKHDGID